MCLRKIIEIVCFNVKAFSLLDLFYWIAIEFHENFTRIFITNIQTQKFVNWKFNIFQHILMSISENLAGNFQLTHRFCHFLVCFQCFRVLFANKQSRFYACQLYLLYSYTNLLRNDSNCNLIYFSISSGIRRLVWVKKNFS